MYKKLQPFLEKELDAIKEAGLWKRERDCTRDHLKSRNSLYDALMASP